MIYMTKAIAQTYGAAMQHRRMIVMVLMAGVAVCAFVYAFNVFRVVSRTVAVQKTESKIASVENRVQSLDARYLELANKITPDMVKSYGMKEGEVTAYILRTASLGRVAMSGHEL